MAQATDIHQQHLDRLLDYIIGTRDKGILLQKSPKSKLRIIGYSDSNWASDKDKRKSISGTVIYVNESLVAWKSKMQQGVALSSLSLIHI